MHSNFQTFRFAIIVTLVCSLLLASAATFLKPRQTENIALDIKKNILKAAAITASEKEYSRAEIQKMYADIHLLCISVQLMIACLALLIPHASSHFRRLCINKGFMMKMKI